MKELRIAEALDQGYIHINDDGVATQMHGPRSVMQQGAQYIRDLEDEVALLKQMLATARHEAQRETSA